MKLEFKLMTIKDGSRHLDSLIHMHKNLKDANNGFRNEFVIVGEQKIGDIDCYKVQQLNEQGMNVFADLDIGFMAMDIPKKDLIWDNQTWCEFDIPKENLSLDTIDDIKRLNE